MRLVKFGEDNTANELASKTAAEIDQLTFGAIQLDASGKILNYNSAEAAITGRNPDDVIGKDFFHDVAPCAKTPSFEGLFREGVRLGHLNVLFVYVFDYNMMPTQVRVQMQKAKEDDTYWVFVKRV
ncbi:MAG: hypothetical protein NVSMB21_01750 [Vulcanimicrobiaceae bacterium]